MSLSSRSALSMWCALAVVAAGAVRCSDAAPQQEPAVSPIETSTGAASGDEADTPDARAADEVASSAPAAPTPTIAYEVVDVYPHDARAYTQGLFWYDGSLYEGTGRNGTSWLRRVEPRSGEVLQQVSLSSEYFGEGIALLGDRIYQLTWLSKRGFVYDASSFERTGEFTYDTEGWGLTTDGTHLILSDGSDTLFFLDPQTQQVARTVQVREGGAGIRDLNELEYVGGVILANVWHSDTVLQIDPGTGTVVGRVDLSTLLGDERPRDPEAVLNGIAYNPNDGHLFVTGKLWPQLFEIRLLPGDEAAREEPNHP